MVKVEGKRVEMTKGDTCILTISIKDTEGNDYTPQNGDVIRFAMKKSWDDTDPLLLVPIPNDSLELRVESSDTKQLDTGRYVFDVELAKADGTVDTIIPRGQWVILEEVY